MNVRGVIFRLLAAVVVVMSLTTAIFYTKTHEHTDSTAPAIVDLAHRLAPIPPGFQGDEAIFAFALFGLIILSTLAVRRCVLLVHAMRVEDEPDHSPLTYYRLQQLCFAVTILLGTLPDALILLAWGEINPADLRALMLVDRFADGLTVVPFFISDFLTERNSASMLRLSERQDLHLTLASDRGNVRSGLATTALIAIIALGVTVGK
jgi:hypothetical protein